MTGCLFSAEEHCAHDACWKVWLSELEKIMKTTIISSDYYNAFYEDGVLKHQAKPDYLDSETLFTIFPDSEYYGVPYDLYEELLEGDGYPELLENFDLSRCNRYR